LRSLALLVLAAVVLSACAALQAERLRPGMSMSEVRARAGTPDDERALAGGVKVWDYVGGYTGWQTWRVSFNAEGEATDVEPLLTAARFRDQITPLRSRRDDVLRAFGRPGQAEVFARTGEEVLSYRFRDHTAETLCDIHIDLATGYVKRVHQYRDPAYASGPST
jgi:hypothetical protein